MVIDALWNGAGAALSFGIADAGSPAGKAALKKVAENIDEIINGFGSSVIISAGDWFHSFIMIDWAKP